MIKHYRELADGEQAITYCHSIEASQKVVEEFNLEGIPSAHIDAKTPKDKRAEIIEIQITIVRKNIGFRENQ